MKNGLKQLIKQFFFNRIIIHQSTTIAPATYY